MGNLVGDKKAVNVTFPSGVGNHGDLYRIGGFTGFLVNPVATGDTDRIRALEIAVNRGWDVKLPSGLTPAVGDLLAWDAPGSTFKKGDTNLVAAGTVGASGAVVRCVTTKNANGYAEVVLVELGAGEGGAGTSSADITSFTNNTAGATADSTLEALPNPTDTPATADALRDDLVAVFIPALRNDLTDISAKINAILAALRTAGILV